MPDLEISGIPGDWREPGRVLWLGSEDGIEEMTVPRLTARRADLINAIEIQGAMKQGKRNTFSMQDDLEAVGQWLTAARAEGRSFAMLVIDPITSYLPRQKLRKVDMNDAGQLRTILEPWLIFAQQHNIAITHFGRDTSRSMVHRVLEHTRWCGPERVSRAWGLERACRLAVFGAATGAATAPPRVTAFRA